MRHVVAPEEAGLRADIVVARVAGVSRSIVADAVKRGDLLLNGAAVKGSTPLAEGDALEFALQERAAIVAEPEAIDVPVVFEDEDRLTIYGRRAYRMFSATWRVCSSWICPTFESCRHSWAARSAQDCGRSIRLSSPCLRHSR